MFLNDFSYKWLKLDLNVLNNFARYVIQLVKNNFTGAGEKMKIAKNYNIYRHHMAYTICLYSEVRDVYITE